MLYSMYGQGSRMENVSALKTVVAPLLVTLLVALVHPTTKRHQLIATGVSSGRTINQASAGQQRLGYLVRIAMYRIRGFSLNKREVAANQIGDYTIGS